MQRETATAMQHLYSVDHKAIPHGLDEQIINIAAPLTDNLGLQIVEVNHSYQNSSLHIYCVIYSPQGVGSDRCSQLHRALLPRLNVHLAEPNIILQISSPGINRRLKSLREFSLFCGQRLKVLLPGKSEWVSMSLEQVEGDQIYFSQGSQRHQFSYNAIAKARLDGEYRHEH